MPNAVNPTTPPAAPPATPPALTNGQKSARGRRINKAKRELHQRADAAYSGPRDMELIGLDVDGRMSLWAVGKVEPVKRFDYFMDSGVRRIHAGHYVIDWKGYAITVHCCCDFTGNVRVQFMCNSGSSIPMPRKEVEDMLLGKVIRNPVSGAKSMECLKDLRLKDLREFFKPPQQDPLRQRGYLGDPKL